MTANLETILALDVGFKKTGIAVGQRLTGTARPLRVLRKAIAQLSASDFTDDLHNWRVQRIIIGWPQHQDGTPHPLHPHLKRLAAEFSLPVVFVDEYLTSHTAQQRLPKKDHHLLDAMAAVILAEDYFA